MVVAMARVSRSAKATPTKRPPFIIATTDVAEKIGSYPNSSEKLSAGRAIGKHAGLLALGLHVETLAPGTRTSWPHAEELEEEFAFVLFGEVDCWIDGNIYPMTTGDLAAFPAGTGICHTFINNSKQDAVLLVGGEANKATSRIVYAKNPERASAVTWSRWWSNVPLRLMGQHDGLPDAMSVAARRKATKDRKNIVNGKATRRKSKKRATITVKVRSPKSTGTMQSKKR
jgi:uncharacterized cupin superfamily protein